MAITVVNSATYVLQGDGVSTSVSFPLGLVPTSANFTSAFNTVTGANVASNVSSVSVTSGIMTVNFVMAFSYVVTLVMNILPALPVLMQGTVSHVDGIKSTYYVSSGVLTGNISNPWITPVIGQIFQLQGSASKVVRLSRFEISGYCG